MHNTITMHEQVRALLNGRQLTFDQFGGQAARFEPEQFRRYAEFTAEFGATHLLVLLPFRYGSWVLPDNVDPYASWCVTAPAILRMCPPEEMQDLMPMAQVREEQALLRAQLDILKEYGLKAATYGVEPMWLPENVYRAHPRWRGAQCELGRIASRPYFCPSLDEPEVLELYRKATREYCTLFPEIEQYSFLSNDSGSGIAWSPNIYPGMNGPVRWRRANGGERIANWLNALHAGVQEAGGSLRICLNCGGLPTEWVDTARARLDPDLFVGGRGRDNQPFGSGGAGLGGGVWSMYHPVLGLGNPADFLGGLQGMFHNPEGRTESASVGLRTADVDLARTLFETYLDNPGQGLLHNTKLSLQAAERLAGSAEFAEQLIGIWNNVSSALHAIGQIRQKGCSAIVPFASVSMRWLIRPLVPEPETLTPEETAYYRNFLFAIEEQKDDPHFGLFLGKGILRGESVMWMSRWCLQEAIGTLKGAQASAEEIARKTADPAASVRMRLYAARIGAMACVATTARNIIMFQYALDVAGQPQFGPNMMDYDDNAILDMRALNLRKIAREEVDNTAELIELLEAHPGQVLDHATCPEEESVFMLGPDVLADLKHKLDIMLDHWQDYERLYPTCRVWDFEPEPRGNVVRSDNE